MEKLSRSLSDRIRRNSFVGVNVQLDLKELEQFLLYLSSSYAQDSELATVAQENFSGLASRISAGTAQGGSTDDELNEIVDMFGAILNDCYGPQELPSKVVAQVHSFVGLLRAKQGRYACAIHSYLKALWLQTSSVGTRNSLDIAITENRLGLAYGLSGNLPQAISLLEKSLENYDDAKMKVDHFCVLEAQNALLDFRSRHLQETLNRHSAQTKHGFGSVRRLGHIQEEREYQSERRIARS